MKQHLEDLDLNSADSVCVQGGSKQSSESNEQYGRHESLVPESKENSNSHCVSDDNDQVTGSITEKSIEEVLKSDTGSEDHFGHARNEDASKLNDDVSRNNGEEELENGKDVASKVRSPSKKESEDLLFHKPPYPKRNSDDYKNESNGFLDESAKEKLDSKADAFIRKEVSEAEAEAEKKISEAEANKKIEVSKAEAKKVEDEQKADKLKAQAEEQKACKEAEAELRAEEDIAHAKHDMNVRIEKAGKMRQGASGEAETETGAGVLEKVAQGLGLE